MSTLVKSALDDLSRGLKMRSVWTALAAEDIDDAHRRTLLGPLWLLFNYLLFAATFVVIFKRGFGVDNYPAYVAVGLLVWLFISETISQSVLLFAREESFIKGTVLPLSVYVMRQCMQSVIRSGYASIGALAILLLTGNFPTPVWFGSALGAALVLFTAPAVVVLFAVAGVILPDLRYVVGNLVRLGMFLTPIFWGREGGGGVRAAFYMYNPFTHYLAIVRAPIHTGDIPFSSWGVCLATTAVLWLAAVPLLGRYRKQIVFLV